MSNANNQTVLQNTKNLVLVSFTLNSSLKNDLVSISFSLFVFAMRAFSNTKSSTINFMGDTIKAGPYGRIDKHCKIVKCISKKYCFRFFNNYFINNSTF